MYKTAPRRVSETINYKRAIPATADHKLENGHFKGGFTFLPGLVLKRRSTSWML
jgi:hypothetical protein